MNTKHYKDSDHFNRDQAIWVLHTIDEMTPEAIAKEFHVSADHVTAIVKAFGKYMKATLEETGS